MTDRPHVEITTAAASPAETAAMIAAVERFLRDTAPAPVARAEPGFSAWQRAALAEGVSRRPDLPL